MEHGARSTEHAPRPTKTFSPKGLSLQYSEEELTKSHKNILIISATMTL